MRRQSGSGGLGLTIPGLAPAGFDADHQLAGTRQLRDRAFSGRAGLARRVKHPGAARFSGFFFVGERKLSALLELSGVVFVTTVFAPIALEDNLRLVVGFFAGDEQPEIRQRLTDVQTQLQAVPFTVTAEEFKKSRVLLNRVDSNRLTFRHRFDVELFVRLDGRVFVNDRKFQKLMRRRLSHHFERAVAGAFLFGAGGSGHGLSSSLHFSFRNPF